MHHSRNCPDVFWTRCMYMQCAMNAYVDVNIVGIYPAQGTRFSVISVGRVLTWGVQ